MLRGTLQHECGRCLTCPGFIESSILPRSEDWYEHTYRSIVALTWHRWATAGHCMGQKYIQSPLILLDEVDCKAGLWETDKRWILYHFYSLTTIHYHLWPTVSLIAESFERATVDLLFFLIACMRARVSQCVLFALGTFWAPYFFFLGFLWKTFWKSGLWSSRIAFDILRNPVTNGSYPTVVVHTRFMSGPLYHEQFGLYNGVFNFWSVTYIRAFHLCDAGYSCYPSTLRSITWVIFHPVYLATSFSARMLRQRELWGLKRESSVFFVLFTTFFVLERLQPLRSSCSNLELSRS